MPRYAIWIEILVVLHVLNLLFCFSFSNNFKFQFQSRNKFFKPSEIDRKRNDKVSLFYDSNRIKYVTRGICSRWKSWFLITNSLCLLFIYFYGYNSSSSGYKLECKVNNTPNFYLVKQFKLLQHQYKIEMCYKDEKYILQWR